MDEVLIVAADDGSPDARVAVAHALRDAARRGGRVRVVSAFPRPEYWAEAYGLAMQAELPDLVTRMESRGRDTVRKVVEAAPGLAGVPVEVRAVCGAPGRVLVDESAGAEGLVVGHRGLGGAASALLGSVGLYCVLHATCPVTVTRPVPRPARAPEPAAGPAVPGVPVTALGCSASTGA